MTDELRIEGNLAETTVPDLYRSLIRSAETGVITLDIRERKDQVFFLEGRVVYATTTDPDRGLCETLMRVGDLSQSQYERAMEEILSAKKIGSILCDLGYMKPETLPHAIEQQVSSIVADTVAYRTGDYVVVLSPELPRDILTLNLNTERLIMNGIERVESWSLIARGARGLDRLLRHAENADSRMFHLDLTEEEMHVYSLCADPIPVGALCDRSYLSNFKTCRTIWALLAVNLLEDAQEAQRSQRRADELIEFELESTVEKYNTAFQSLFGIVFQRSGDQVYDFVDKVVVHLAPEMLPYLSGTSMLNEGRVDFDQILDNLIASGSADKHAVVDGLLSELLYGWILEVRKEFGPEIEAEVNKVIEALRR